MSLEDAPNSESAHCSPTINDSNDEASFDTPGCASQAGSEHDPYDHIQNQLGLPMAVLNELAGTNYAISK